MSHEARAAISSKRMMTMGDMRRGSILSWWCGFCYSLGPLFIHCLNVTLRSGQLDTVAPRVRCLVAPNPGLMTGPGTNTDLLGEARCFVIDPGPATPECILQETGGRIAAVLVTYTYILEHDARVTRMQAGGETTWVVGE